jgi:hypothetical protein
MHNSTLIAVFRLFRPDENQLLAQLIDTPLFKLPNRHSDTSRLFQYLLQGAPDFQDEAYLSKEHVASQLFGHRSQPQSELRKAMSNLLGILKKFVLFQQFNGVPGSQGGILLRDIQTDLGVLKWLVERSGDIAQASPTKKPKTQRLSKTRVILSQQYRALHEASAGFSDAVRSFNQREYSEWHLSCFWQEYELYDYFGMQRSLPEQQQHLLMALEALDRFYYQCKMSMTLHLQVNLLAQPPSGDMAPMIDNQFDHTRHMAQSPPAHLTETLDYQLYSAVFHMLLQQDAQDNQYETIEHLMRQETLCLPAPVLQTIRIVLNAYCAIMYNRTGERIFLQRRLELQKTDLENELRSNGNTITATRLSGTVSNALLAGEQHYAWVADLLERFWQGAGILATDTPREVFKVNRAHLLFHQGAYRDAANELIGYEWYGRINDAQILLLAIRIDLKTQFELGQFESDYMLRTLDAAEKRITRLHDINEQLRSMTLRFLRLIRQIGLTTLKGRAFYTYADWKSKMADWETYIQKKPIAEKTWLKGLLVKMTSEAGDVGAQDEFTK